MPINCASSTVALVLEACYAVGGAAAVPSVTPTCLGDLMAGQLTRFAGCLLTGMARRWGGGVGGFGGGLGALGEGLGGDSEGLRE